MRTHAADMCLLMWLPVSATLPNVVLSLFFIFLLFFLQSRFFLKDNVVKKLGSAICLKKDCTYFATTYCPEAADRARLVHIKYVLNHRAAFCLELGV